MIKSNLHKHKFSFKYIKTEFQNHAYTKREQKERERGKLSKLQKREKERKIKF